MINEYVCSSFIIPRSSSSSLLQLCLPFVDEAADVVIAEVQVGQLVALLDGAAEIAGFRIAVGELEHDLLAQRYLVAGQLLQRFFKIALCQTPVVAALEAIAEIDKRAAVQARVAAGGLQLFDRLVGLPGAQQANAELEAVIHLRGITLRLLPEKIQLAIV